jgi:hypothetical protein
MNNTYQPSGKFSPSAIPLMIIFTAIFSIITSVGYALAIYYNPIIYISVLLPFIWSFLIVSFSGWTIKAGHMRNPKAAGCLAMIGVIPGYVFHWLIWISLVYNQSGDPIVVGSGARGFSIVKSTFHIEDVQFMLANPDVTVELVKDIAYEGIWSVFGQKIKGIFLWLIWAGELVVFLYASFKAFAKKACMPYSENKEKFYKKVLLKPNLMLPPQPEDWDKLLAGQYDYIFSVAQAETQKKVSYLSAEFFVLDGEPKAYMSVKLFLLEGKKKGVISEIISRVEVDKFQIDQLFGRLGERL